MFYVNVLPVWWLQDTIMCSSSLTFMIMKMTHKKAWLDVPACLWGLDVRCVCVFGGLICCPPPSSSRIRTCFCSTRRSASSRSSAWTITPSRRCGWWTGPARPRPHLYALPRGSLTTATTPPPAGQRRVPELVQTCQHLPGVQLFSSGNM